MNQKKPTSRQGLFARYLEPEDRLAEVIYGLLIVMTFTLTYRSIDVYMLPADVDAAALVRRLFLAAFGCVIAWGMIDSFVFILLSVFDRAEYQRMVRAIHAAQNNAELMVAAGDALDDEWLDPLHAEDRASLHRALIRRYQAMPLPHIGVTREDFYGAFGALWGSDCLGRHPLGGLANV